MMMMMVAGDIHPETCKNLTGDNYSFEINKTKQKKKKNKYNNKHNDNKKKE